MTSPIIQRPAGISRTIFIISLVVVGAVTGSVGYYAGGGFRPGPTVTTINGAGATFPYPLLSAMGVNYSRTHLTVAINYNSQGSSFGRTNFIAKTIDFGASDAPLSDSERGQAPGSLHIPETIGSVVLAYNLKEVPNSGLQLDGATIAMIYSKNMTWNDPAIQNLNPNLASILPARPIRPVHRSDGSGTTFIFTNWMAKSSGGIWSTSNTGSSVTWPNITTGLGGKGNEGVAGSVLGNPDTIGYVELNYAIVNKMKSSYFKNPAGTFVQPTQANSSVAVDSAIASQNLPTGDQSWTSVTLLNAPGANSYPIVGFSYLLVYKELNVVPGMDQTKAKALVDFLWWVVHDGQALSSALSYVRLPQSAVTIDENTIKSITFNGQILHT